MILRESKTGLACMSNEQTKKARKDWKDEAHQRGEGKERERRGERETRAEVYMCWGRSGSPSVQKWVSGQTRAA